MKSAFVVFVCTLLISLTAVAARDATWHGVQDARGLTWARVLIINNSTADSNWSITGCRTAVTSSQFAAQADAQVDWDGVVAAGSREYVWVYGHGLGEVNVINADGGVSAYSAAVSVDENGDGTLVIDVSEKGDSGMSIELDEPYSLPAITGTFTELPQ